MLYAKYDVSPAVYGPSCTRNNPSVQTNLVNVPYTVPFRPEPADYVVDNDDGEPQERIVTLRTKCGSCER